MEVVCQYLGRMGNGMISLCRVAAHVFHRLSRSMPGTPSVTQLSAEQNRISVVMVPVLKGGARPSTSGRVGTRPVPVQTGGATARDHLFTSRSERKKR